MKHETLTKENYESRIRAFGLAPMEMTASLKANKDLYKQSLRLSNFNHYFLRRLIKIRKGLDYNIKASFDDVKFSDIIMTSYLKYDYFLSYQDSGDPQHVRCEVALQEISYFLNPGVDYNLMEFLESHYYIGMFLRLKNILASKTEILPAFLVKGDLIRLTDVTDLSKVLKATKNCKIPFMKNTNGETNETIPGFRKTCS